MINLQNDALTLHCIKSNSSVISYILYPMDMLRVWAPTAASHYYTSIACISGMDWDNDLSPWPAPGQPPGSADFQGHAEQFLQKLSGKVVPQVENALGLVNPHRVLVGVSMSGLFTLWQRFLSPTFPTIVSLSGSFWYSGFAGWVERQPAPTPCGNIYMSLGNKESQSPVKAFRRVADDTQRIYQHLLSIGVPTTFESVPGNHYADPIPRLDKAFSWIANTIH